MLVLSRNYPNRVQPLLGLWVERPTALVAVQADVRVVAPVPWVPRLPDRPRLHHLRQFGQVPAQEVRSAVCVRHPRYVVGPGHRFFATERRSMLAGVWPTVRRLHAERPVDVLHAHFAYPDGAVAAELGRRLGIPVVVTEHAQWRPFMDGMPSYARQVLASSSGVARYLAVSSAVRDTIVHFTSRPEQVHVVPNGVDPELFVPDAEQRRDRDEVLFVGMPRRGNKGVEVLLQAMEPVLARRPATRLTVVGGAIHRAAEQHMLELRKTAGAPGLAGKVTFTGALPPAQVASRMARAAVVVLPSHIESFGAVLVEALACGTPVVATRSGGPQDLVTPEVGRLCPTGDPAALAAALLEVLDHPDHFPVDRLRAHAVGRYSWSSVAERVLQVYEEVIAG